MLGLFHDVPPFDQGLYLFLHGLKLVLLPLDKLHLSVNFLLDGVEQRGQALPLGAGDVTNAFIVRRHGLGFLLRYPGIRVFGAYHLDPAQ